MGWEAMERDIWIAKEAMDHFFKNRIKRSIFDGSDSHMESKVLSHRFQGPRLTWTNGRRSREGIYVLWAVSFVSRGTNKTVKS